MIFANMVGFFPFAYYIYSAHKFNEYIKKNYSPHTAFDMFSQNGKIAKWSKITAAAASKTVTS